MAKYIDPLTDPGFKIIFGKPNQSEEILMGFLNSLFQDQPFFNKIISISYDNNERSRNKKKGKTIIHDVVCTSDTGHRFILEMQKGRKDDFLYRSIYYTFRGITDQINISSRNNKGKYQYLPVISVFICNFNIKDLEDKLVSHFMLMDTETSFILKPGIRSAYIQLPEFKKNWDECENYFDQWIYILKNMHRLKEFPELTRKDEVFARLESVASYAELSEEDRIAYEADLKWISEYEEEIDTARREAQEIGIAEGRAEGENIEKWRIAKLLKNNGETIEYIAQITGLPISSLLKELS